jgi:hypothetical protein
MHHLLHNHFKQLYGEMTPPGSAEAVREVLSHPPLDRL